MGLKKKSEWEVVPWEPHEKGFCIRLIVGMNKNIFLYGYKPHFDHCIMGDKKVSGEEIFKKYPEVKFIYSKEILRRS